MTPEETPTRSPVRLTAEEYLKKKKKTISDNYLNQHKVVNLKDAFVAVRMAKEGKIYVDGKSVSELREIMNEMLVKKEEMILKDVREWLEGRFDFDLEALHDFDERFLKVKK